MTRGLDDFPTLGQPTGHECGNTALAAVAKYFGRAEYTVKKFRKLARTTEDGTDHADMVGAAVTSGAAVFVKSGGTIDELARFTAEGMPVIVGWWSMEEGDKHYRARWSLKKRRRKDCGHYSVVRRVTATDVILMDPQDDAYGNTWGHHAITREMFETVWYDTDTDRYDKVERWMMVVDYEGRTFSSR